MIATWIILSWLDQFNNLKRNILSSRFVAKLHVEGSVVIVDRIIFQ